MAKTTQRKQTPAQARKAAIDSDLAPLYAVAGLTDLLANSVRGTLTERQQAAMQRITELRDRQAELEGQVRLSADELVKFVSTLPDQVKSFPAQVRTLPEQLKALPNVARTQVAGVQQQGQEFVSVANARYADLAGRGKRAVDSVLVTAQKSRSKAEDKADDVFADVTDAIDPALAKAQDAVADVRKNITGRSATPKQQPRRTAAQKAAAKQAPAKAAATKKASASTAAAGKASATKAGTTKASTTTASTTKPSTTKPSTTKAAAAKKAPAKKAPSGAAK